jgi:WXG100 family type VII secretion target
LADLSVYLDALISTAQTLANQTDELKSELDTITQQWTELSSTWTGVAASAFEPPWDEWHYGAVTVMALLEDHAETLRFCAAAYAAHEQSATEAVRAIHRPGSSL